MCHRSWVRAQTCSFVNLKIINISFSIVMNTMHDYTRLAVTVVSLFFSPIRF